MFSRLIATFCLLDLAAARAFFVPAELQHDAAFWAADDFVPIRKRDDDTCGAGLDACGGSFPSDFCCSTGTTCLSLNTTSTITAALCCPAGQDCQTINPINCDQELQDASSNPGSQLHSNPTAELETCGTACCPMGYTCNGAKLCVAQTAAEAASSKPSSTSSASSPTSTNSDTATTSTATEAASTKEVPTEDASSSGSFSGKSFAAGFVPGIALGAFLTACIIFICVRKERRKNDSYVSNEKQRSPGRDTLTDLGPFMTRRPTVHGRSISEPTVDMSMGHRTEFLNSSPLHHNEGTQNGSSNGYTSTPETNTPPRKNWLSHSPFVNQAKSPMPTQSPLPSHLKRGTLSFQISPVRALKKQRSMHSLRRQMTSATSRSSSSRRNGTSRTDSTETIKVLMATPEHPQHGSSITTQSRPTHPPLPTVASWETAQESTNNTPIDAEPTMHFPNNRYESSTETPTRPGRNSTVPHIGATLNSPYTPSNYPSTNHLAVRDDSRAKMDSLWPPAEHGRDSAWRHTAQTTFSGMMLKAGLRKSQLLMGPDPREWNK